MDLHGVRIVDTALDRVIFAASMGLYWALSIGNALTSPGSALLDQPAAGDVAAAIAFAVGVAWVFGVGLRRRAAARLPATERPAVYVKGSDLILTSARDRRKIPRAHIRSGVVVRNGSSVDVELELQDGTSLSVGFQDKHVAEDFLGQLRLGPAEQRARFVLVDSAGRRHTALFAAMVHLVFTALFGTRLGTAGDWPGILDVGVVLALAGAFWTVRALLVRRVEVGLDRVDIHSGLRTHRIPMDEIEGAEELVEYHGSAGRPSGTARPATMSWKRPLRIRLTNGKSLRVEGAGLSQFDQRLGAVARRIEDVKAARAALAHAKAHEALARRPAGAELRGERVVEWRDRVARLLRGQADYRSATLSPEDLARVARNPEAPAEQRIGAALALGAAGDAALRREVRVVADACLEPRLRVALKEALREAPDEEAIIEALAEAERHRG